MIAHGGYGVAERIVQRDGSPADFGAFKKTIDLYPPRPGSTSSSLATPSADAAP